MKKEILPRIIPIEGLQGSALKTEGVVLESHPVSTCEKVKEFRGNLIANVSHDLRTPLQSIIGFSETLLLKDEGISSEDRQQYLNTILASANKLSNMIEQFFEYSKIEVSEIAPDKTTFSPKKLAEELCQNYQLITSERKIDFSINLAKDLPFIYGDYLMIYRVFQNLIDNSLKFTPANGMVTVYLTKHSSKELQVRISDTGPGIPSSEFDSIFNKFQTTKETAYANEQNDGLGLGLAIVKKILSLHDSKILVKSELGAGTTFTFFLPAVT